MKRTSLLLTCICIFGLAQAQAQLIWQNDFESVTPGSFSGGTAVTDGTSTPSTDGAVFGASALLGNASGNRTLTVSATGGVGNSAMVTQGNDPVVRSRATHDMTTTTTFDFYFLYNGSTTTNNGFVGAGWARADNRSGNNGSGIDGNNPFNTGQANRFEVGLMKTGVQDETKLAVGGQFNGFSELSSDTATLTAGNWYQMTFDLTFNQDIGTPADSNFDVANVALLDWGTDGQTGGSTLLSLSSATGIDLFAGNNFDTDNFGYTYLSGNAGRGVSTFDKISATAVPEPSSAVLILGAFGLLMTSSRRRRL